MKLNLKEYLKKLRTPDSKEAKEMLDRNDFLEKYVRPAQNRLKDHLVMLDNNMSVWTNNSSYELSKGCQCCREGTGICLYTGPKCDLDCSYCPQGDKFQRNSTLDHDRAFTISQSTLLWIDDTKLMVEDAPDDRLRGVSYSGGEPFLYLDKVVEMGNFVKEKKPNCYQWIYTNGVLADRTNLTKVFNAKIDEIRFHISASNFADKVMDHLKIARGIFPRVTVEIPVTQKVKEWMIDKDGLKILEKIGIEQLNLAELFYYPNDPRQDFNSDRYYPFTQFPFPTLISEIKSRVYTYEIIEAAINRNIDILINDCSNERKVVQMVKRLSNPYFFFWRSIDRS